MKARQKNKQAEKWKALFKEYNGWLSQYDASLSEAQKEFISQCVPIPQDLLKHMAEIRAKAQENREKEEDD